MTPETKFHSLVLGLTVTVMLSVILLLVPYIQEATVMQAFLGAVSALLLSSGIYRVIAMGLVELLRRSRWLKSKLLGPYYLEGTWVGYFEGHEGDIRYVVEVFEQDLSSLTIVGRSYTIDGRAHAQWASEAASLDVRHGRLITYTSSLE